MAVSVGGATITSVKICNRKKKNTEMVIMISMSMY